MELRAYSKDGLTSHTNIYIFFLFLFFFLQVVNRIKIVIPITSISLIYGCHNSLCCGSGMCISNQLSNSKGKVFSHNLTFFCELFEHLMQRYYFTQYCLMIISLSAACSLEVCFVRFVLELHIFLIEERMQRTFLFLTNLCPDSQNRRGLVLRRSTPKIGQKKGRMDEAVFCSAISYFGCYPTS